MDVSGIQSGGGLDGSSAGNIRHGVEELLVAPFESSQA